MLSMLPIKEVGGKSTVEWTNEGFFFFKCFLKALIVKKKLMQHQNMSKCLSHVWYFSEGHSVVRSGVLRLLFLMSQFEKGSQAEMWHIITLVGKISF